MQFLQIEDINIPMLPEMHDESKDFLSFSRIGSNFGSELNTESSNDWQILSEVDFSRFFDDIHNTSEDDLQNFVKQLYEKVRKIQDKLETVEKPNFKVYDIHKLESQFPIMNLNKCSGSRKVEVNNTTNTRGKYEVSRITQEIK
jgi:hypothetical protein